MFYGDHSKMISLAIKQARQRLERECRTFRAMGVPARVNFPYIELYSEFSQTWATACVTGDHK